MLSGRSRLAAATVATALVAVGLVAVASAGAPPLCPTYTDPAGDTAYSVGVPTHPVGVPVPADSADVTAVTYSTTGDELSARVHVVALSDLGPTSPELGYRFFVTSKLLGKALYWRVIRDKVDPPTQQTSFDSHSFPATFTYDVPNNEVVLTASISALSDIAGENVTGKHLESMSVLAATALVVGEQDVDTAAAPAGQTYVIGDACAAAAPSPSATTTASPTAGPTPSATPSPTASATPSPTPTVTATQTAAGTPSPTASPTATPTASVSAVPASTGAPTPTPTPTQTCGAAPTLRVVDPTITVGGRSRYRVTSLPGDAVRVDAYSRPSTTYRTVRSATTIPASGYLDLSWAPATNSALRAVGRCGTGKAAVVAVHPKLSVAARRTKTRTFTFSGTFTPGPQNQGRVVTLYRKTSSGYVKVGSTRVVNGRYSLSVAFRSGFTQYFRWVTATTLVNTAGSSPALKVRVY